LPGLRQREAFRDGPVTEERIGVEIREQFYNREIWRNTVCSDCGQRYRVIEYRYEPDEISMSSAPEPPPGPEAAEPEDLADEAIVPAVETKELDPEAQS
jgi:hypothetical protein